MFLRLLRESLLRQRRRKVLAVAALALGVGVTTATLSVAVDLGDKVARELRSFGANILVQPKADSLPVEIGGVDLRPLSEGSFLEEDDLPRLKSIFWRHHILAFAPFLYHRARLPGRESVVLVGTWYRQRLSLEDGTTFVTGIAELNPGWELQGSWPLDHAQAEAVVGAALAERFSLRPGSLLGLDVLPHHSATVAVRGILRTGGEEDRQVFVPLAWLQRVANRPRSFRRLQVSALVSPEDEFAQRDPRSMTPAEYDRWYCTPYVSSIAHQIEEVLGDTEARPIQRVAQAETSILSRVERLLALVSVAALLGAVLAVLSTMTTGLLERRSEIAVMKALGADPWLLAAFFLGEALLLGLLGGASGYFGGWAGARLIAASVFGASITPPPVLLPAMLMLAVVIAVGGTLVPLRMVERTHPALVLKER